MKFSQIFRRILLITAFAAIIPFTSCTQSDPDINEVIADAETAAAAGDFITAGHLCSSLTNTRFDKLDDTQLGRLAVIYMKMSETENGDECIAEATICLRRAWKISNDSLRSFISTLSPEDLPHFVMLTRISGSIETPPDLTASDIAGDSI